MARAVIFFICGFTPTTVVTLSVALTLMYVNPAVSVSLGVPARTPVEDSVMPGGKALAGRTKACLDHVTVVM